MKKIVLIIVLLMFSFNSFAKSDVVSDINLQSNNMNVPMQYTHLTSCGITAVSYSYEPVWQNELESWYAAMEEYYCG